MNESTEHLLERILRLCAQSAPEPWYPSVYARQSGTPRDDLDPSLDHLRLNGLIHLTDWVAGTGQGYRLTADGEDVLKRPRLLAQLNDGTYNPRSLKESAAVQGPPVARSALERGEAVRYAFADPFRPAPVTRVLIFLNVAVFVAGLILCLLRHVPLHQYVGLDPVMQRGVQGGVMEVSHDTGALFALDVPRGEWWRLLSCCFVHFGLIHLAVNMWGLSLVGPLAERMFGSARFLILYLISGLGGSCTVVAFTVAGGAGASGCLWGIVSGLVAWTFLNREFLPSTFVANYLRRLFFVIFLNAMFSMLPGISAAGHFGGGVVGLVAAVLLNEDRFGVGLSRLLARTGVVAIPIICLGAMFEIERRNPLWQVVDLETREHAYYEAYNAFVPKYNEYVHKPVAAQSAEEVLKNADKLRTGMHDFSSIADDLRAIRPYEDPDLEKKRQQTLEHADEKIANTEALIFGLLATPFARKVNDQAVRTLNMKALPLLKLPPRAREPASVDDVIISLEEDQRHLGEVTEMFNKMGPFQTRKMEDARKAAEQYISGRSKLLGEVTDTLRHGQPLPADLQDQDLKLSELRDRWNRLLAQ